MAILSQNETIIALDLNFSNGGGSHSATIRTVLDAKDLDGDNIGSLIGSSGRRTTFSDSRVQELMQNFIEIEVSTEKTATSVTKTYKYEDRTSLKLKSHCVIVRGKDSHPKDLGIFENTPPLKVTNTSDNGQRLSNFNTSVPQDQYNTGPKGDEVIIPYFGELPNTPIRAASQRYPKRAPKKIGGIIFLGNIYNEESSVTSQGVKTSLVYQDKEFKESLSYNSDVVGEFYKKNPDLANYNLRYGYSFKELKEGLARAGITVVGLPETETDEVLFEESGTLDSILSSVAAKFGYYWFVEPFKDGVIRFVNSSSASALYVTDPFKQSTELQKTYINASFSENYTQPKIVNAFSSTAEKQTSTFEFGDGTRTTRFKKLDPTKLLDDNDIDISIYRLFYPLWVCGKFNMSNFDKVAWFAQRKFGDETLKWGRWWSKRDRDRFRNGTAYKWNTIKVFGPSSRKKVKEEYKGGFPLEEGYFMRIGTGGFPPNGPDSDLFTKLRKTYEITTNALYASNYIGEYKARRMNFQVDGMSVIGPEYVRGQKPLIMDIPELAALSELLGDMGKDFVPLSKFFEACGSSGSGDYGFVGRLAGANNVVGETPKAHIKYEILDDDEKFEIFSDGSFVNETYLAWTRNSYSEMSRMLDAAVNDKASLFDKYVLGNTKEVPKTIRASFTRSKVPTDGQVANAQDRKARAEAQEAAAERQAKLDAAAEAISEVAERFDIRYYSLKNNGATGEPLNPISLDTKSGSISDILALEKSNISTIQSTEGRLQTSSRTIVGLSIPEEFRITLSGLSIKVGSSGVTTTISESTKKLLPPDQQLIIDNNSKVTAFTNVTRRLSAGQRNALGL